MLKNCRSCIITGSQDCVLPKRSKSDIFHWMPSQNVVLRYNHSILLLLQTNTMPKHSAALWLSNKSSFPVLFTINERETNLSIRINLK